MVEGVVDEGSFEVGGAGGADAFAVPNVVGVDDEAVAARFHDDVAGAVAVKAAPVADVAPWQGLDDGAGGAQAEAGVLLGEEGVPAVLFAGAADDVGGDFFADEHDADLLAAAEGQCCDAGATQLQEGTRHADT